MKNDILDALVDANTLPSTFPVEPHFISLESSFLPGSSPSTASARCQPLFSMTIFDKNRGNTNPHVKVESLDFCIPNCRASLLMPLSPSEQTPPHSSTDIPPLAVCHTGHSLTNHTKLNLKHPISKSHTRRCREKISRGFDTLLSILPDPAPGKKIKHKAQILEQALCVFRTLLRQRTCLQANLVLTSTAALASWTSSTLTMCALKACENGGNRQKSSLGHKRDHVITLQGSSGSARSSNINVGMVLQPFIGLYCMSHGWPYAEVWLVQHQDNAPPVLSLSGCVYNVEDHDLAQRLEGFAEESRVALLDQGSALSGGVLHRVSLSGAPEWLTDFRTADDANDTGSYLKSENLSNHGVQSCISKDRTSLARKWGLRTALVIPSMELSSKTSGQGNESPCDAVVFLGDLESRLFNMTELEKLREHLGVIHEEYKRFLEAFDPTKYLSQE